MKSTAIAVGLLTTSTIAGVLQPLQARQDGKATGSKQLPTVKLPYGEYRASSYDATRDIYSFKNIRFAAPPVGSLRFARPAPPNKTEGIQENPTGGTCIQSVPMSLVAGMLPPSLMQMASNLMGSLDIGKLLGGEPMQEDCLFLDVIVPGKALRGEAKLPVLNWIYGGAYILGSKGGMYDGTPLVKQSKGNIIYVAGNYRLGSLGFLSGTTLERDDTVATNAGLYDQRAVMEWIHKYIHLFGGMPEETTVMGESAGGGSIVHHLTAFGGKLPPLFKRAVIQSSGYSVNKWQRKGEGELTYQNLLKAGGCQGKGIECLRALSFKQIQKAQDETIKEANGGTFGFGPAADGKFVRQLPQLELVSGNHVKGLESIITTHVTDEAEIFTAKDGNFTDAGRKDYFNWEYANNSAVTNALIDYYPSSKYPNQRAGFLDYSSHASFTCTSRYLADAYPAITRMAVYTGLHGSDLTANFYDATAKPSMLSSFLKSSNANPQYQAYLVSYAQSGSPNKFKDNDTPEWPFIKEGPEIGQVLGVSKVISIVEDPQTKSKDCDILKNVFAAATAQSGLAPPGSVVPSTLVQIAADSASRDYGSGGDKILAELIANVS